jgi:DNA-binding transcriptional regulator YbjK
MLADAAIEILARSGVRGLTHRAVDEYADLPRGTTSNYFRSRDSLLQAAAERVVELHRAEMEAANDRAGHAIDRERLAELIGAHLHFAATEQRSRYLAIYELSLEATRSPALRQVLDELAARTLDFTVRQHRALGLSTSREDVRTLISLFGGALFTLASGPPDDVTPARARTLARTIVHGTLGMGGAGGEGRQT